MSSLAVKTYCAQALANIDVPAPVQTFVQEFKQTEVGSNIVCWISRPHGEETRLTIQRATGMRQVVHDIVLVLEWTVADEQVGGNAWDVFLDKVDDVFRKLSTTVSFEITDPETGAKSAIWEIGEQIKTEELETKLDEATQGMVLFSAVKTITVKEVLTG